MLGEACTGKRTDVTENGMEREGHEMADRPIPEKKTSETVERYSKTRTLMVEVQGEDDITTLEMLKAMRKECGVILGCRSRGERRFEVTMETEEGKGKVMDGIKVRNNTIAGKEMNSGEMTVSFLGLPVYIGDEAIVRRLNEWGVTAASAIRRRMWPGTEVADGTRYLRVRFTEEVRSLPYSTRFQTIEGVEHFRVIHDRQERVCRLCIRPGHIFRECPEFRCHRCAGQGHYARECTGGEQQQHDGEEQNHGMGEEERRRSDESGREEGDVGSEKEGEEETMREEEGETATTGKTPGEGKTTEHKANSGEGEGEGIVRNGGEGGEARNGGAGEGAGGGEGGIETEDGRGESQTETEVVEMNSGTTDSEENTKKVMAARKRPMGKTRRPDKPKKKNVKKCRVFNVPSTGISR